MAPQHIMNTYFSGRSLPTHQLVHFVMNKITKLQTSKFSPVRLKYLSHICCRLLHLGDCVRAGLYSSLSVQIFHGSKQLAGELRINPEFIGLAESHCFHIVQRIVVADTSEGVSVVFYHSNLLYPNLTNCLNVFGVVSYWLNHIMHSLPTTDFDVSIFLL